MEAGATHATANDALHVAARCVTQVRTLLAAEKHDDAALKAAWPLWSATKPSPDSPPAEGDLGRPRRPLGSPPPPRATSGAPPRLAFPPRDSTPQPRPCPPSTALRVAPRLVPGGDGHFIPQPRSSGRASSMRTRAVDGGSSVTIWPAVQHVVRAPITDSIGPQRAACTSLTCRKPPNRRGWSPRAFVTRTWKASFRVSGSWRRGVRREVVERGPPAGAAAASSRDRGSSLDSRRRRGGHPRFLGGDEGARTVAKATHRERDDRGSTKREHNHIAMSAAAKLASALDARLAGRIGEPARPLRFDL